MIKSNFNASFGLMILLQTGIQHNNESRKLSCSLDAETGQSGGQFDYQQRTTVFFLESRHVGCPGCRSEDPTSLALDAEEPLPKCKNVLATSFQKGLHTKRNGGQYKHWVHSQDCAHTSQRNIVIILCHNVMHPNRRVT